MSELREQLDRLEAIGLDLTGLNIVNGEAWITVDACGLAPLGRPSRAEITWRDGADYFSVSLWWCSPGQMPVTSHGQLASLVHWSRRQESIGWMWLAALADFDATMAAIRAMTPAKTARFGSRP